jgi:hypothetical protein
LLDDRFDRQPDRHHQHEEQRQGHHGDRPPPTPKPGLELEQHRPGRDRQGGAPGDGRQERAQDPEAERQQSHNEDDGQRALRQVVAYGFHLHDSPHQRRIRKKR